MAYTDVCPQLTCPCCLSYLFQSQPNLPCPMQLVLVFPRVFWPKNLEVINRVAPRGNPGAWSETYNMLPHTGGATNGGECLGECMPVWWSCAAERHVFNSVTLSD